MNGKSKHFLAILRYVVAFCLLMTAGAPSYSQELKEEKTGVRIYVEVGLVLVPVSVVDVDGRPIVGLQKEHFELYEEKKRQEILHFSAEPGPISVCIVFDASNSMSWSNKMDYAKKAVVAFMNEANPQDEFCLITFSNDVTLRKSFRSDGSEDDIAAVRNRLAYVIPEGETALFDAVYLAFEEMKNANNSRKILLVISDGGDNRSRHSVKDVKQAFRESDVQLYAIGIFDPPAQAGSLGPEYVWGPHVLDEMAESSGGSMIIIDPMNIADLTSTARMFNERLRTQYVLAYRSANTSRDGKWRKIEVKLKPPRGLLDLYADYRRGYFAPSQ